MASSTSPIVTTIISLTLMVNVCQWTPIKAEATNDLEKQALRFKPTGLKPSTYKAAVLEHKAFLLDDPTKILTRQAALAFMNKNLNVYRIESKKAMEQGAQIIVFPEYGIYGNDFTRESVLPFLEEIPDVGNASLIPCSNSKPSPRSEVQTALSCIAKNNGMFVVANMADKVPCQPKMDPKCPKIGHYQYNTNVAYSSDGTFIAKYHKVHLWYEDYFDPAEPEAVYFDTPFAGRVGLVICFDLLFADPLITLITKHDVKTIAYPTDFYDFLPAISALGFHSSVARGLGITILSANLHDVPNYAYGSGIYTKYGTKVFYYDDRLSSPGKLLVSSVNSPSTQTMPIHENTHVDDIAIKPAELDLSKNDPFEGQMFGDTYMFRLLDGVSGNINVCQKNVCCSLNYTLANQMGDERELFALGAFDGPHKAVSGRMYLQVCTLIKCASDDDKTKCGQPTKFSSTKLESLSMKIFHQAKYVYPQVILSSGQPDEQLRLARENTWSFSDNTIAWGSGVLEEPLLSAAMVGRLFDRDTKGSRSDSDTTELSEVAGGDDQDDDQDNNGGSNMAGDQTVLMTLVLVGSVTMLSILVLV